MKKILLGMCLCVLLVGAAFAAMSDEEFMKLCQKGTPQQVEEAIKGGVDVNAKNKQGFTPIMVTAQYNTNPEAITTLIKAGADVNAENKAGATALMAAIFNSNPDPEVITTLIKAGADVNAKAGNGWTPLILVAMSTPNPEVITTLIKAGADVHAKDKDGKRAIDFAKNNKKLLNTEAYRLLEAASK